MQEKLEDVIWKFGDGVYKVFVEDPKKWRKIGRWQGVRPHARYDFADGRVAKDFLVPARLRRRAVILLGFARPPKSRNRVLAGKKSGAEATASGRLKRGTACQGDLRVPPVGDLKKAI